MKLSAHYTKASVVISLTVLIAGAIIYFFAINIIANNQLDRNLKLELEEAEEYATTSALPPQYYDIDRDHAVFIKTNEKDIPRRFF
jgi:hypothetical protein